MVNSNVNSVHREPWNKGKIVGQKAPFKKDIWTLRGQKLPLAFDSSQGDNADGLLQCHRLTQPVRA